MDARRMGCAAIAAPAAGLAVAGALVGLGAMWVTLGMSEGVVDLFLYTAGGAVAVASPLVGLVLGVIAISRARSEGTSLALGVTSVGMALGWLAGLVAAGLWVAEAIVSVGHGRPLRVRGKAAVAGTRRGSTPWSIGSAVGLEALSPDVRARLAAAWRSDGQLEHAAIAAFARLTNDLLAVGAPPELVEGASRAAADEVRHARACFSLASAYAGEPIGPAPFPEAREATTMRTREELLTSLLEESIVDGVLGEGLAARVAARGASRAEDPVVAEVLRTIARDEAEHASLAEAIVDWARDELGARGPLLVEESYARAARELSREAPVRDDADDLASHGRCSPAVWRRMRHELVRRLAHRDGLVPRRAA